MSKARNIEAPRKWKMAECVGSLCIVSALFASSSFAIPHFSIQFWVGVFFASIGHFLVTQWLYSSSFGYPVALLARRLGATVATSFFARTSRVKAVYGTTSSVQIHFSFPLCYNPPRSKSWNKLISRGYGSHEHVLPTVCHYNHI